MSFASSIDSRKYSSIPKYKVPVTVSSEKKKEPYTFDFIIPEQTKHLFVVNILVIQNIRVASRFSKCENYDN